MKLTKIADFKYRQYVIPVYRDNKTKLKPDTDGMFCTDDLAIYVSADVGDNRLKEVVIHELEHVFHHFDRFDDMFTIDQCEQLCLARENFHREMTSRNSKFWDWLGEK